MAKMNEKKMVAPDGGWGWIIALAYALNHFLVVPIMQSFGLIFKDTFAELGFSATDGAIIINCNAAFSMLSGFINGPMLKYFGYRKVSYASATLVFTGVILTAYARSFTHFILTYGLVTSLGMGMSLSSYPLALNSYFVDKPKRSRATGYTMTIAGLGPVLMPQLISLLLYFFNVTESVLLIGAVASHAFIAASLLQPVRWHMKAAVLDEENGNMLDQDETKASLLSPEKSDKANELLYDKVINKRQSIVSADLDLEVLAIYGADTPLGGSVLSLNQGAKQRKFSNASFKSAHDGYPMNNKWWSATSVNKNDQRLLAELKDQKLSTFPENEPLQNPYNPDMTVDKVEEKKPPGCCQRIATMFDLSLLKDPIYCNIMIGMSLAVFAELNFSMLTPFILVDFDLNTNQIATFLSMLSVADLCFRFLSPYIGNFLNKPARIMYMFSLLLLISTRFTLLMFTEYYHLLGVAVCLGVAKGIRTVYWTLVIPNYVPIEKLANASSIQMIVNGLCIIAGGPVLGYIRDVTGSYKKCVWVMNMVTFTTVIMWTVELLYLRIKAAKKAKLELQAS